MHAFPRGRRAFAEIVSAWYDADPAEASAGLLPRLLAAAARVPRSVTLPPLPAFYNFFPAGYHFLVAEGLFLTSQFEALHGWLEFTQVEFPELATLESNVYNELLRAFGGVARLRTGRPTPRPRSRMGFTSSKAIAGCSTITRFTLPWCGCISRPWPARRRRWPNYGLRWLTSRALTGSRSLLRWLRTLPKRQGIQPIRAGRCVISW